jgi:hypothetical protein
MDFSSARFVLETILWALPGEMLLAFGLAALVCLLGERTGATDT